MRPIAGNSFQTQLRQRNSWWEAHLITSYSSNDIPGAGRGGLVDFLLLSNLLIGLMLY